MLKTELKNKAESFAQKKPFVKENPKQHDYFCRPYPPLPNTILSDELKAFLEASIKANK